MNTSFAWMNISYSTLKICIGCKGLDIFRMFITIDLMQNNIVIKDAQPLILKHPHVYGKIVRTGAI